MEGTSEALWPLAHHLYALRNADPNARYGRLPRKAFISRITSASFDKKT
jgi:hypothetical protein